MLGRLFDTFILKPRRMKRCVDYGFVADETMDAFCNRFDTSLVNMYYAMCADDKNVVEKLVADQKAIQEEGGERLKEYLALYFSIARRWKTGEWGNRNPPTTSDMGRCRFRTANNWRE